MMVPISARARVTALFGIRLLAQGLGLAALRRRPSLRSRRPPPFPLSSQAGRPRRAARQARRAVARRSVPQLFVGDYASKHGRPKLLLAACSRLGVATRPCPSGRLRAGICLAAQAAQSCIESVPPRSSSASYRLRPHCRPIPRPSLRPSGSPFSSGSFPSKRPSALLATSPSVVE